VFGRLDMKLSEIRYVGRIGVRTREHDSLVIDWRAPAAEAFYRATPENPQDVIRRRVLHSRGHAVIDIEDDLLDPTAAGDLTIVGDGAFLASLARTRDGSMRDIVATIQREQDEVIRAPADGTVIVRGGPGTGKTAVALHRVAYLLFRHRRRFGTRGVLVVGPNRRFTAYIERVLPSLGEGSAVLRSLGELVDDASASVHDSPDLLRIKGAGVMARVLRRAVTDHAPGAPDQLTVVHAGWSYGWTGRGWTGSGATSTSAAATRSTEPGHVPATCCWTPCGTGSSRSAGSSTPRDQEAGVRGERPGAADLHRLPGRLVADPPPAGRAAVSGRCDPPARGGRP